MDKRKVNGGGAQVDDLDDRAAKRRRTSDYVEGPETAETTTKYGLQLVETLKNTTDKNGRKIAEAFLELPSKRNLPDYYDVIKMPIAIDAIEKKLNRGDFENLSALESYFKRMISNAKEYNKRDSTVYEDSERLRKALSNFMTRYNPAYKVSGYQAQPTPLPKGHNQANGSKDTEADAEGELDPETQSPIKRKSSRSVVKNVQAVQVQRSSATPALSDAHYAGVGFEGLTFQQAQEKIVEDLIQKKEFEKDDFGHFEPFLALPSRTEYKDYYKVIKNPVSLRTFQRRVKGAQGRNAATGVSEFKSWAVYEDEACTIWNNAFEYNEDGSPIYKLAQELERTFKRYLQEAKAAVPEPAGTKIKLKLNDAPKEKIMLKFGSRASPVPSPAPPTPAVLPQTNGSTAAVAETNGSSRRNPFGSSQPSATPAPSLDQLERARSASGSAPSPTPSNSALVKKEDTTRNSPAVASGVTYRGNSQAVSTPGLPNSGMLPPSTPGLARADSSGGYTQSFNHQSQSAVNSNFEAMWRAQGKDASDAMISNLSLATHPGLNISNHFKMDLPPSPNMTHQSITINLPASHYMLQIKPTISPALFERQHKLFVTSGSSRLHALPTIPGHPVDTRHPLFEARLNNGVNRIEVEMIAASPKGAVKANGQDVELEKITVFVNLMKS